jgi:hypothetical protein
MNDDIQYVPQMLAAEVLSPTHFVVALGELAYDDPFSIVLEYDAAYPQPWSRTDISRALTAISAAPADPAGTTRFAAVSNEGDVYLIGDQTAREKIMGAGLASPDSAGLGGLYGMACIAGRLYAAGQGEQIYERPGPGRWDRIGLSLIDDPKYQSIAFGKIRGSSASDIYVLGVAGPALPKLDETTEQQLLAGDDWDAWFKANDEVASKAGTSGLVEKARVLHCDGAQWRELDLPTTAVIEDVYIETTDKVWLVGTGGTILVGSARRGFKKAGSADEALTFLSFTKFKDGYVVASDYALHSFDGQSLTPLKARLRKAPPTPFKVQAVNDRLVYFDYKQGIHRFDGTNWEALNVPPELLQRTFKGLTRRSP